MIVRSSTDLPLPEPPTTPSTSPRRTSRSSWSCSTRPPRRVTSPRTRMMGPSARSDMELREEDRERGIDEDHQEDRFDHGEGGGSADALGAPFDGEPATTADDGDAGGEERRLQYAEPERPFGYRIVQLAHELDQGYAERDPAHQRAAEQRHEIGVEGKQRQGEDEAEESRQDEHVDGIEPERAQRVDLLVDLHGAELGSKGAARASGDDDGGEQDAELAQHAEAEQLDDGQRRDAGALHLRHHRHRSEPRRLAKGAQQGDADQAEEAEQLARGLEELERLLADELQRRSEGLGKPEPRRGHGLGRLALGHLVEQGGEGLRHVLDAGGDAAPLEAAAGAQHKPGADRVEHLNASEIDAHGRRGGEGVEAVQAAIELRCAGDQPTAARLQDESIIPPRDLQPAAATLHGGPVYTLVPF